MEATGDTEAVAAAVCAAEAAGCPEAEVEAGRAALRRLRTRVG